MRAKPAGICAEENTVADISAKYPLTSNNSPPYISASKNDFIHYQIKAIIPRPVTKRMLGRQRLL
jgi:hypothetical protein